MFFIIFRNKKKINDDFWFLLGLFALFNWIWVKIDWINECMFLFCSDVLWIIEKKNLFWKYLRGDRWSADVDVNAFIFLCIHNKMCIRDVFFSISIQHSKQILSMFEWRCFFSWNLYAYEFNQTYNQFYMVCLWSWVMTALCVYDLLLSAQFWCIFWIGDDCLGMCCGGAECIDQYWLQIFDCNYLHCNDSIFASMA